MLLSFKGYINSYIYNFIYVIYYTKHQAPLGVKLSWKYHQKDEPKISLSTVRGNGRLHMLHADVYLARDTASVDTYVGSREVSASRAGRRWRAGERSLPPADQTFHWWEIQRAAAQMCSASGRRWARRHQRIWGISRMVGGGPHRGCCKCSSPVGGEGAGEKRRLDGAAAAPSCRPEGRPWVWSGRCIWTRTACRDWCRMSWSAADGRWRAPRGAQDGGGGRAGASAPPIPLARWGCARCRTAPRCACDKESALRCRSAYWSPPQRKWGQSRKSESRPLEWWWRSGTEAPGNQPASWKPDPSACRAARRQRLLPDTASFIALDVSSMKRMFQSIPEIKNVMRVS